MTKEERFYWQILGMGIYKRIINLVKDIWDRWSSSPMTQICYKQVSPTRNNLPNYSSWLQFLFIKRKEKRFNCLQYVHWTLLYQQFQNYKMESNIMLEFRFPQGKFKRHCPGDLDSKHCDLE